MPARDFLPPTSLSRTGIHRQRKRSAGSPYPNTPNRRRFDTTPLRTRPATPSTLPTHSVLPPPPTPVHEDTGSTDNDEGWINETVAAKAANTVRNGGSHLDKPVMSLKSSIHIDLSNDDDDNDDNDNDNDEPNKLDLSSLPNYVKTAIGMGELSHETAEILHQEAMAHAKEEYERLKERGRS